jgi:DNA polymerase elongation subunit (family B)
MEIKFIPIDYDYFDWQGRNWVRLIGRDEKGKRVCVIDSFSPHLYAVLKEDTNDKKIQELIGKIDKIQIEGATRTTKVESVRLEEKNFLGKSVKALKISITNHKDAHPIADKLDFPEIEARREYDISLITKYISDKKIIPLSWYKVKGEILNNSMEFGNLDSNLDCSLVIKAEKMEKMEDLEFSPKILAYDIETDEFDIGKGEILMISLAGKNFKKVLTWKKCSKAGDYVECFKDEGEMIEKFVEYVKKFEPDFLVGYFSDGFDLPYLRARAEKNKVRLSIGLDNSQPTFARGRIPSANISGIVHIDLFRFIETVYSQYLESETLGLNDVALELLGEGKKEFSFKKSSKFKEEEWSEFFEYNLQDSQLTWKLGEKFWPDMLEFSKILQEPLFDITRDGMSQLVETYIIHNLEKYNEIVEKRPIHSEIEERRNLGKYEGAYVFQPVPKLYDNVVMFDFTSMYSSVIVTYNLSKSSFLEKKEKDSLEVDLGEAGKVHFSKKQGFFSQMLAEIIEKRKLAKKEYKKDSNNYKKARSNAYKLIANAAYGYQGFFGARYYCREAAASTAALAKKSILETIEKIKKAGYDVIYSDTDSIAFLRDKKNKTEVLEFLEKLNKNLPGIMELELEDFYKRGIWVAKRSSESGAKKKYALITEQGKMKIRGFETVRRDWCTLARELQSKVLGKILEDGNEKAALEIVKKLLKNLKERKVEREEILIRTQLKKPLSEYKAITPHVIAAQKMKEKGTPIDIGMSIEYFIAETRETKKLVREKVKLPDEKGEYNIEYYLEHQILPAVENIFDVFNISVKDIADGSKQKKLF